MIIKNQLITLIEVKSNSDYEIAITLFKEYASSIEIDLEFQNFNEELENLKNKYSRPQGLIYIVFDHYNSPIGCFGIRALNNTICELKRMYLKEGSRGFGIGKLMMKKSIEAGKRLGYHKMRLDTLSSMRHALTLYKKSGFYEIDPYCFNPIPEATYFEINLLK
jgi:GNAT superfamily N-acetyltransferase